MHSTLYPLSATFALPKTTQGAHLQMSEVTFLMCSTGANLSYFSLEVKPFTSGFGTPWKKW